MIGKQAKTVEELKNKDTSIIASSKKQTGSSELCNIVDVSKICGRRGGDFPKMRER